MPLESSNSSQMTLAGPGPPVAPNLSLNSSSNQVSAQQQHQHQSSQRHRNWSGKGGRRTNLYEGGNLNHLLGFSFTPRNGGSSSSASRASYKRSTGSQTFKPLSFNKERYVHVQHRFVVRPTFNPTLHMKDADVPIPWNEVLQIIVPINSSLLPILPKHVHGPTDIHNGRNGGFPNCPICLEVPRAGRMTPCGHTYCYPCILHYLELSEHSYGPTQRDNKYQPCPVCGEGIWARELKSVRLWNYQHDELTGAVSSTPRPDTSTQSDVNASEKPQGPVLGMLKMRLMYRSNSKTISLPSPSSTLDHASLPLSTAQLALELTTSNAQALRFSKFTIPTSDYYLSCLRADVEDLAQLEKESQGDGLTRGFVDRVRAKVEREIGRVTADVDMGAWDIFPEKSGQPVLGAVNTKWGRKKMELESRSEGNITPVEKQTIYNFYQAASGEQLFLSPLDYRILKEQYNNSPLPLDIQVPVEHVEWLSIGEDTRRRYKWLGGGTALTTEVGFVEVWGNEPERIQRRTKREERIKLEEKNQKAKEKEQKAIIRQRHMDDEQWMDHVWRDLPTLLPDDNFATPLDEKEFIEHPRPEITPDRADAGTTVWGTRVVPVVPTGGQDGSLQWEDEDEEARQKRRTEEIEAAWRTLEDDVLVEQVIPDNDKKGRKKRKKTVLSLAGGGAVMGRR